MHVRKVHSGLSFDINIFETASVLQLINYFLVSGGNLDPTVN